MGEDIRSRSERLDPGGEGRQLAEGLAVLASPPWSDFLRSIGVGHDDLAQVRGLQADYDAMVGAMDDVAGALAPLGWVLFEEAPWTAYQSAADFVRLGQVDEAEKRIVDAWNEADATLLRLSVQRVHGLYRNVRAEYTDLNAPDIGHARALLIHEAVESHRDSRYACAINVALAQIDGIVADFAEGGHLFFSRDRETSEPRANVTDELTLAGHPEALLALAMVMTRRCETTEIAGRLVRHGIMHGRELGYGTLRNSTQALATLLAVITWAQPIARARLGAIEAERETQYAGTHQRDQHGRRLWREGFAEAKKGVAALTDLQDRWHERYGRYAASVEEIDRGRTLRHKFAGAQTACAPDAQSYWAWVETPAEYVFGYGGQDGGHMRWQYAGDVVPKGGPGSGADWRHPIDDPGHPDW